MAQFGFVLDEDLVLKKRTIYSLFSNYFGDPVMTKIKDQNVFSMYAARKNVLLRNFNYLIVLTRRDFNQSGTKFNLSQLKWKTLQTRTLDNELACDTFSYIPNAEPPYNSVLKIIKRNPSMSTYSNTDYNFSVGLLRTNSELQFEYPSHGTLASALETYQTIIQIEA